jgi:hypothetical protein
MAIVSSDYNLAAIHSTLPGRRHPSRTASPMTPHVPPFSKKFSWWLFPRSINGRLNSVTGTTGPGVLCGNARRRSKLDANVFAFSHVHRIKHSIAIVEYLKIKRLCKLCCECSAKMFKTSQNKGLESSFDN